MTTVSLTFLEMHREVKVYVFPLEGELLAWRHRRHCLVYVKRRLGNRQIAELDITSLLFLFKERLSKQFD